MFCPKCGTAVQDDAAFCAKCGSAVAAANSIASVTETQPAISPPTPGTAKRWGLPGVIAVALCLAVLWAIFGRGSSTRDDRGAIDGSLLVREFAHREFAHASEDAKEMALRSTIQSVRAQLELYKLQHGDEYPTAAGLWDALTRKTSFNGETYGPYLQSVPVNPFNQSSTVGTAASGTTNGWAFVPQNGGYTFCGLGKAGTWIGDGYRP